MTCNPKWPELLRVLQCFPSGTTCLDIPVLTCRLFNTKLRLLINDILSGNIFGKIISYVYTIEFQKRGLPHAHILVTLHPDSKIKNPKDLDKIISAEIPEDDDQLLELVMTHMIHGPHEIKKLKCYNESTKTCKYKYPKQFCEHSKFLPNGFPQYKRRNNEKDKLRHTKKLNGRHFYINNSIVVPHNRKLIKRHNCHINVEYCASLASIKYIYTYIHKGYDRALLNIGPKKGDDSNNDCIRNEINNHIDGRYVSAMEAAWKSLQLPMSGRSHAVIQLDIHLENHQQIIYEESKISESSTSNP